MQNDQIKTHLTTAYMMFVFEFHDPSSVDLGPVTVESLFDTQKTADKAKRQHGRDGFRKLLSLYFNQYQKSHGLDIEALDQTLTRNKKVFYRHIGRDKFTFLCLIVTLLKAIEEPKPKRRGLLYERVSA